MFIYCLISGKIKRADSLKLKNIMEFQIPKFIERQTKIVWIITFRQFIFLILMVGGIALLRLILPPLLFMPLVLLAVAFAFATVFIKIQGRSFLTVFLNFLNYSFGSKIYLWKKKAAPVKLLKETQKPLKAEEKKEASSVLEIAEKSQLKKMARRVEIGSSN